MNVPSSIIFQCIVVGWEQEMILFPPLLIALGAGCDVSEAFVPPHFHFNWMSGFKNYSSEPLQLTLRDCGERKKAL